MAVASPELPTDVVSALSAEGEDADAALARLFQEQEHAWFLANGGRPSDFGQPGHEQEEEDHTPSNSGDDADADNGHGHGAGGCAHGTLCALCVDKVVLCRRSVLAW